MVKPRFTQTVLWLFVLGFPLLTAFQNCAGVLRYGNGGGYEGEDSPSDGIAQKRTYVNFEAPGCADGKPRNVIMITNGDFTKGDLKRKDCANLEPFQSVDLSTSAERPWPTVVIFEGQLFQEGDPELVDFTHGNGASPPPGPVQGATPAPAPTPGPVPPAADANIALYCHKIYPGGDGTIQIYLKSSSFAGPYLATVDITRNGGIARAEFPGASIIEGTRGSLLGIVIRAGSLNTFPYFELELDPTYAAGTANYSADMTMPADANLTNPIYGMARNGGGFTNSVAPLECFPQTAGNALGSGFLNGP